MNVFYHGVRGKHHADVWVFGRGGGLPLDPRTSLRFHAGGFEWGYGGGGPCQLALAILADATQNERLAVLLYHAFKWDVVSQLSEDVWSLDRADVLAWVRSHGKERLDDALTPGNWNDGCFLDDGLDGLPPKE